jgi:hypothetical protein
MIRQYDSGKISTDRVLTKINIYAQTEKRAKLMLQSFALAAKFRNKPLNRAFKANLIGDGTAIDTTTDDPENEQVKCPGLDYKLIKRFECLDWSGERKFNECEGCETGLITKSLLLSNEKDEKI